MHLLGGYYTTDSFFSNFKNPERSVQKFSRLDVYIARLGFSKLLKYMFTFATRCLLSRASSLFENQGANSFLSTIKEWIQNHSDRVACPENVSILLKSNKASNLNP